MSKASHKFNRKRQRRQQAQNTSHRDSLAGEIRSLYQDRSYAEVINTLAEYIQMGGRDAEMYALGAWSYYRLGDYERAGKWVDATLTQNPGDVSMRILLAHLCLHDDRVGDALAVLSFILEKDMALDGQQRVEIEDMLAFYGKHEAEMLQKDYPACWAFLQELREEKKSGADTSSLSSAAAKNPQQILQDLKERLKAEDTAAENKDGEAVSPEGTEDSGTVPSENNEDREAVLSEDSEADGKASADDPSLQQVMEEISDKPVSLSEKVELFRAFAAASFWKKDYAGARQLLSQALAIDGRDDTALRDMVITCATLGEKEEAAGYLAKMKHIDFALLWMLQHNF